MVSLNSIDPDRVPTFKMVVHGIQIIFIFVIFCLEINIFVDGDSNITGQNGWTFGACFLTIPAWVYLLMTPRWDRTRHLAHPIAMLAVDAVFTVVWFSAFASQAAFNTANNCGGACGQSKAIVGLGVVTTLTWIVAILLSFITYQAWRTDGSLPGYDQQKLPGHSNIDPDKAAFSMAPHDEEAYAPVNMDERDPLGNDEYASGAYGGAPYGASRYDDDDEPDRFGAHSARPNALFESDTSYGGGGAPHRPPRAASPPGDPYAAPSGRNPFEEPAQFPAGNYDRVV